MFDASACVCTAALMLLLLFDGFVVVIVCQGFRFGFKIGELIFLDIPKAPLCLCANNFNTGPL